MTSNKMFTLNNGLEMPSIGIGTFLAPDAEIETALDLAIEAGYRHIDTAPVYQNEKAIGRVLKKWLDSNLVKREDLYIVTKLPQYAMRPENVEATLKKKSLEDLQISYVDMYLIHGPVGLVELDENSKIQVNADGTFKIDPKTDHVAIWKKMEEMVELGLTKSIGISNFNKKQIQKLVENGNIKPANLQIELHLYFQQKYLVDYCKNNNILVTAYSPLGSSSYVKSKKPTKSITEPIIVLKDPEILKLAEKYSKTPAQILLRWIIQRGICPIPKSTNPERLKQNLNVFDFELLKEEMIALSLLDKRLRLFDGSTFKGTEKHPEFPW